MRSCCSTFSGLLACTQPQPPADADANGCRRRRCPGRRTGRPAADLRFSAPHRAGAAAPPWCGDFSAVVRQQHLTGRGRCLAPCACKSRRSGRRFPHRRYPPPPWLPGWGRRQRGRGIHQIHTGVGTLGGEPHGDHQLIVLRVVQGAGRIVVALFEDINDGFCLFFFVHENRSFYLFCPNIPRKP